ncbi:serine/threonine-protein kinase [Corynebacterium phocae]|uniref:serine/threonine-protein kinase n=1 Tax=Corynebacterium phocae TaxID=161895 RepID=UPI000953462D|nr:serine/threonine-protein kinase [Corynebacterium phocae]KAA8720673.1 serine/threonine protein kinase [Corynebacterium phocae]
MMDKDRLQKLIGPDYTLQWTVGHGGMSTVWLADDNRAQREVAIKVLRPEFSDNEEFLGRFRNEAESAQQIHSPNVVETYDYRELEDTNGSSFCFMALEYVRGESLAGLLAREKQLPEALALDIMEQSAQGLADIHSMGMVHRDIKPGNLLISQNGVVKITDFGIAKAAAAVPLTRTGMVVGTAQYVSPEQAQGQEVTTASDVYSLGVVGYEMLAGRRPFVGDSSVSVALAHINQAPDPLPTAVSAPARELVGNCLRKDPATRYPGGQDLATAISDVRFGRRPPQPAGTPIPDSPPSISSSAATSMISSPAAAAGAAAAGASATAGAASPAQTGPRHAAPAVQPGGAGASGEPAGPTPAQPKGRGGLIAVLTVLGLGGAAVGAYFLLGNDGQETPAPDEPTVVTEWLETTQEQAPPPPPPSPEEEPSPPAEKSAGEKPTSSNRPHSPRLTVRETTEVPVTVTETKLAPPPPPPATSAPPAPDPLPDASPPELPRETISPTTSKSLPPFESLVADLNKLTKTPSQ